MENYLEGYESVGVVQGPPVVVPEKKKQSNERALYGHTSEYYRSDPGSTCKQIQLIFKYIFSLRSCEQRKFDNFPARYANDYF